MIDVPQELKGRHLTRVNDWSKEELRSALDLADALKAARRAGEEHRLLPGRTLAMIFHRQSLRTRVSFAAGMTQLGGTALDLPDDGIGFGVREPVRDVALALSRYADAIMIRTTAQEHVDELAEHATVPVINGLSDQVHPCQALTDLMTIREHFGRLSGVRLAYLGDGNNVCRSLMRGASKFGMRFIAATPPGYEPRAQAVEDTRRVAIQQGGTVELTNDPHEAVDGAQVVYTDVWVSMGQEAGRERRLRDLAGFAVDRQLVARAADDAVVMHCLPAHYGEEIAEDVVYGPRSLVWEQAENRLHAQKALLALVVR
ncbi:MAG TPA: ornithine carbamoyltransferase [Gaiellaceae bacterium]|nr:ornithine carbamoyltransferase [Gaiellaceae bacterium]